MNQQTNKTQPHVVKPQMSAAGSHVYAPTCGPESAVQVRMIATAGAVMKEYWPILLVRTELHRMSGAGYRLS
jgi:hypothetical protein